MKKLSLLIPLEMHRALKRQALNADTTISAIIQQLITRYLLEHGVKLPAISTITEVQADDPTEQNDSIKPDDR